MCSSICSLYISNVHLSQIQKRQKIQIWSFRYLFQESVNILKTTIITDICWSLIWKEKSRSRQFSSVLAKQRNIWPFILATWIGDLTFPCQLVPFMSTLRGILKRTLHYLKSPSKCTNVHVKMPNCTFEYRQVILTDSWKHNLVLYIDLLIQHIWQFMWKKMTTKS